MASNKLLAERDKIQEEILALENTLLADNNNITDVLPSDSGSDDESDDSGPAVVGVELDDLVAARHRIQREIEEIENTLGVNADLVDILTESEQDSDSSNEDSDNVELDLPQNVETCLQMNLVYQEVLKEKLDELEKLLRENQQQQKEIEAQFSGPSTSCSSSPGLPSQKLFLGYFMKPYFKDKLTSLGPPANEETKERMSHGTRSIDELKIKRWEVWQKALLTNAVATDTVKRMLQPKLSKLDYLNSKMSKAEDEEKEELKKQMHLIDKDIADISAMREEQLSGGRNDDHDWEKISNIDLTYRWTSVLDPSIKKGPWSKEEDQLLRNAVAKYGMKEWGKIRMEVPGRTDGACRDRYLDCLQENVKKGPWSPEEVELLKQKVEKYGVGFLGVPISQTARENGIDRTCVLL
ncbi:snRNA-activating protein complex subunit 4 [Triplophysa tibetana]|uniref:snRNA-activating protein complex subunit 4 n=1 Tax=Triplophysa tibetana TaxID=1572043 RepID=A0A5A9P635_9TELE|nr:snRNA-activating protein complex subunit 4 [Triplophysa tibetana]